MATRFIHAGLDVPTPVAKRNGFAFDRNDNLSSKRLNSAGTVETLFVPQNGVKTLTADATLTYADHGKIIVADSTTTITVTLPATKAGITYTLAVKQLTTAGGHAFSPNAADKIMGNGFTAADDKDAICTAATDRVGDTLTIVGDGVDGWFITGVTGTWARE